jgi:hypothetical protein
MATRCHDATVRGSLASIGSIATSEACFDSFPPCRHAWLLVMVRLEHITSQSFPQRGNQFTDRPERRISRDLLATLALKDAKHGPGQPSLTGSKSGPGTWTS